MATLIFPENTLLSLKRGFCPFFKNKFRSMPLNIKNYEFTYMFLKLKLCF